MTWPIQSAPNPNNFVDHFPGSSLSSRWTAVTSGGGTVTVTDSYVDFVVPASASAFIYYNTQLDKTKSQLWLVCASRQVDETYEHFFLFSGASAPIADTAANLNAKTLVRRGVGDQASFVVVDFYFDNAAAQKFWDGTTGVQAWVAFNGTLQTAPAQNDDYYIYGFEIDGPGARWRLHTWAQSFVSAGTYTFDSGSRYVGQSDWVTWANTRASANIWLALGNPANNRGAAGGSRVEWVRYIEAQPSNLVIDGWFAGHQNNSDGARIRHSYSLDGKVFVPQDRTSWTLDFGGTYDSFNIGEPTAAYDGVSTDYLFYTGSDSSGNRTICVASAPHVNPQNGPFTKYASNPIVPLGSSGANDDSACNFPYVWMDNTDTDSNKRWKMLYGAKKVSDGKWRTLYATAPTPLGTWTKQGVALNIGAGGSNDELAARDPVVIQYGNQYEVWYAGWLASGATTLLRATGPDMLNLVKDGVNYQSITSTNTDQALTANLTSAPGRTVTVSSTTGFTVDAPVIISQSTNPDTYNTSTVRKIVSSTVLELYHGVTGFTTTYPARIKQLDSSPNWSPRNIFLTGSEWWFYLNQWEPFLHTANAASYSATMEEGYLYKHSNAAPSGATPVVEWLPGSVPTASRGFNTDQGSYENIALLLPPLNPTISPLPPLSNPNFIRMQRR